jgi:DNA-directed RNA polymerase I, II, and III subunit RPABC2
MSSYFDNQYGGEDEDNKFQGDDSDSDDASSSSSEEEIEEIENDGVIEELPESEIEDEDVDEDVDEDDEQSGGAPDDDLEEGEIDEEEEKAEQKAKRIKKIPAKPVYQKAMFTEDDDDEEEDSEMYLQKFDQSINENYIVDYHPESVLQNYDEILSMIKVIRDKNGIIIDDLHKTIPYLTKYEKARILGQRAKQINSGSTPFVKVPENVIDGYIIAELELKEKKVPFIIRRPLPNGGSEYWSIKDLEDISF